MASILSRLFRKKPPAPGYSMEAIEGGVSFSRWSGDAYANDIYRGAVDAVARNAGKLKGSHVVHYHGGDQHEGDNRVSRLLQIEPNPYMTAFDMLYKLVTHYFLYNNAFAYLQRDERRQLTGIYPLSAVHVDFLIDTDGALYCHFIFVGGKDVILPYTDIVHLRRNFNSNELLGDPNTALSPALQLAHTQNEGIMSAIKNSAHIRGILKRNTNTKLDALKEIQEYFTENFLSITNNGGVLPLDSTSDYIPLESKPYTIDDKQMQAVAKKIYDYLGVSEAIVSSSYTEDQWAAFYESTIEPIAVQLSLEFTRKVFNERERAFGNSIMFESGRLQFSSSATKVRIIRELMPMGLFTVNQALDILNLPAVPDGERRIQSLNYVDADKAEQYQLARARAGLDITPDSAGKEMQGDDEG